MKPFWIALQFLTRLKIVNQSEWTVEDFGKSVLAFPAVGLIIGLFMVAVYALLESHMPHQLLMLVLVVFEFLFTGGLHADGFIDTCDGLFSGRDRERKLEIMKDSRIGSNGVVGFVFLVLLKWQLLTAMESQWLLVASLICMPLFSRYTMAFSIISYPYARKEGMGKAFSEYAPTHTRLYNTVFIAALWLLIICVAIGLLLIMANTIETSVTQYGILPFEVSKLMFIGLLLASSLFYISQWVVALVTNKVVNNYIVKHLGGTTGDTYGFVTELTEIVLLLAALFFGGFLD